MSDVTKAWLLYKSGVDLEGIRILMRHTKFDTTKEYIQMAMDDALEHVRKKDLDFKESRICVNPGGVKRPGREWFLNKQILPFSVEGPQWSMDFPL